MEKGYSPDELAKAAMEAEKLYWQGIRNMDGHILRFTEDSNSEDRRHNLFSSYGELIDSDLSSDEKRNNLMNAGYVFICVYYGKKKENEVPTMKGVDRNAKRPLTNEESNVFYDHEMSLARNLEKGFIWGDSFCVLGNRDERVEYSDTPFFWPSCESFYGSSHDGFKGDINSLEMMAAGVDDSGGNDGSKNSGDEDRLSAWEELGYTPRKVR